jgi:hypothetical protein
LLRGYPSSMAGWWFVLAGVPCALGAARVARARRQAAKAELATRITAAELGLERFPPAGALVQFSNPNPQSRVSLNRLAMAAAHHPEVALVELPLRARLAARLRVRSAPTVLHVDPRGEVRRRWSRAPERPELDELLDGQALAGAASR